MHGTGTGHPVEQPAPGAGAHGRRAYALLDGIGGDQDIQSWTRTAARRLARAAARAGALDGLREIHAARAAELAEEGWRARDMPMAVAVVAVAEPGKPLEVAWCGDARAYVLPPSGGQIQRLTTDHNMRQVLLDLGHEPRPYARNRVTSYLGDTSPDAPIGSVTVPTAAGWCWPVTEPTSRWRTPNWPSPTT